MPPVFQLSTVSPTFDAEFQRRLHWSAETDEGIEQRVADILADVRQRGDEAVLEFARQTVRLHAMNDLDKGATVTVGTVR